MNETAPASAKVHGLYFDLPEADYHGHPTSLSKSGAMKLLPPSCPAKFRASLGKEVRKRHFDLGKVVHQLVLGAGAEFVVVQAKNRAKEDYDATSYDTVSAQGHRDVIYGEGRVPILRAELDAAEAMAKAVREHPIASHLFRAGEGEAEVSAFWDDPETGVTRRARFDWLPEKVDGRRLIVPDLKTARSAEPFEFGKAAADFGYYMQAAQYTDALIALGIDSDPAFLFVVVEKTEPYVVTVCELDDEALQLGRAMNRMALRTYAECVATDTWPGYTNEVAKVSLPGYFTYRAEEYVA